MKKFLLVVSLFAITIQTHAKNIFAEHKRRMAIPGMQDFFKVLNNTVRKGIMPSASQMDMADPSSGTTLLMHAAMGESKLLQRFLSAGANPTKVNNDQATVVMFAAMQGRTDNVKILLTALKAKGVKIADFVNKQNEYGMTALMYAAQYGSPEVVDILLNAGANPNLVNTNGNTAFFYTGDAYVTLRDLSKRKNTIDAMQQSMIKKGYSGSFNVDALSDS
jgi:ankyrin repeat protein